MRLVADADAREVAIEADLTVLAVTRAQRLTYYSGTEYLHTL